MLDVRNPDVQRSIGTIIFAAHDRDFSRRFLDDWYVAVVNLDIPPTVKTELLLAIGATVEATSPAEALCTIQRDPTRTIV